LVDTFLGFAENSFEKSQAAFCRFSKEFMKIREMRQPIRRKGLIQNRTVHALPVFKRVMQIQKHSELSRDKFNVILKGKPKKLGLASGPSAKLDPSNYSTFSPFKCHVLIPLKSH
jgi:hypothetical protein